MKVEQVFRLYERYNNEITNDMRHMLNEGWRVVSMAGSLEDSSHYCNLLVVYERENEEKANNTDNIE